MEPTSDNSQLRNNILRILRTEGAGSLNAWLRQSSTYLSQEVVSKEIASVHPELNLFEFLAEMTEPDPRHAINLVLEGAKLVESPTLEDVVNLMKFIQKVDPALSFQAVWLLEEISKANRELMQALLIKIKEDKIDGDRTHLAWAGVYSKIYPEDSINFIQSLDIDDASDNFLRIALFNCLEPTAKEVAKFHEEFSHVILPSIIELIHERPDLYMAWQALCLVSEHCGDAVKHLKSIPENCNLVAQGVLLRWMVQKRCSFVTIEAVPVRVLLLQMMPHVTGVPELHTLFDAVVSQMLSRSEMVADGLAIFNTLKMMDGEPSQLLNLSSHAIFRSAKLFTEVLTDWLMSKESTGVAIRSFLQQCNLEAAPCKLDDIQFQAGSSQDRKRAVMRIAAQTHSAPSLSKFVENFVDSPGKHPDGITAANTILEHMLQEYPSYSVGFLEKKVLNAEKNSVAYAIYNHAYLIVKKYKDAQNELPTLNELAPTSQQQIAMHQREVRSQREIGRMASEKSIMAQLAHKVTILQGTRVATLMPDGALDVTEMHSMSYSIELPMSERADPLGGMINRNNMLESAK